MHRPMNALVALACFCALGGGALAQDMDPPHELTGTWRGEATFLLPEGITEQVHEFTFDAPTHEFVTGEHSWDIPGKERMSHDGKGYTHTATEAFLGVIGLDGVVWLVEHGDTTKFQLRLIEENTLEFIGMEGGDHPVVGHGVLARVQ